MILLCEGVVLLTPMTRRIGSEEDGTAEEALEAFEKVVEIEQEQGDKGEWCVFFFVFQSVALPSCFWFSSYRVQGFQGFEAHCQVASEGEEVQGHDEEVQGDAHVHQGRCDAKHERQDHQRFA
jgi:hypothetical protein